MQSIPNITATGTRGFLKWLQAAQPGIYAKIAPQLPAKAPQLFSDFEDAGGVAGAQQRALAGLGASDPLATIDLSAVTGTTAIPTVDVASAANSSATDPSTASWLSSLINGVSSAYMTYTQAQNNQQIVNAQLQRAQDGLPPLSISPGANGVPTIGVSSMSSWLLPAGVGLAVLAGFWFMASGKRR